MDLFEGLNDTDQVVVALTGEQIKYVYCILEKRGRSKIAAVVRDQLVQATDTMLYNKED